MVTGAHGQLGSDVIKKLAELGISHIGIDKEDFDITDETRVYSALKGFAPDGVIHCAAYTDVDGAQEHRETCRAVNEEGTRNVATACAHTGAKLISISTDYVFSGEGTRLLETGDARQPLNVYGETKMKGEDIVRALTEKHFIVRTSRVFGINGNNFIKTMLRLGRERDEVAVVNDQIGSPTYTYDLAALLCDMIHTDKYGVYHAVNEGYCSFYELAVRCFCIAGLSCRAVPVPSAAYKTKANRPLNTGLSTRSLTEAGFNCLPPWEDAVDRFMRALLG